MHWRQAPMGSSRGWSQKRGMVIPSCSAARMTRVPLGTSIRRPSMVTATGSVRGATSVMVAEDLRSEEGAGGLGAGHRRRTVTTGVVGHHARVGCDGVGQAAVGHEVGELVAEVLDGALDAAGGTIAQRAERAAEDVVTDLVEHADVLFAALAGQEAVQDLGEPEGALPAWRALAAGLMLVEARPVQARLHHAGLVGVHHHRRGTEHGAGRRDALVVHGDVEVIGGEQRRRGAARSPELQRPAGQHAAAGLLDDLARGHAQRPFVVAGPHDLAGDAEDLGAGDFSLPMERYHSTPCSTMCGTFMIVSTLFTTVGEAYSPATAGKGGRSRGWPRRPSSAASSAVSSPQM